MGTANALSEDDLAAARAAVAGGAPFTVWFTPAAVGVPTGGSAKVVAIGDAADGDFIQVKAAGSRDTMFCSPNELTATRPPRRRRDEQAPEPPAPARRTTRPAAAAVATAPPAPPPPAPARSRERTAPERPAPSVAPRPAAPPSAPPPSVSAPVEPPAAPRRGTARPPARPAGVTVTLTASPEGEWTVEVVVGAKRTVRPSPVPPGDVAKAARALPAAVGEAIESALEAARRRQSERVERLRAELEAAQRALQDLGAPSDPSR